MRAKGKLILAAIAALPIAVALPVFGPGPGAGAASEEAALELRVYDLRFFERDASPVLPGLCLPGRPLWHAAGGGGGGGMLVFGEGEEASVPVDLERLLGLLRDAAGAEPWTRQGASIELRDDGAIAVHQTAAAHEKIAATVAAWRARLARVASVEVRAVALDPALASSLEVRAGEALADASVRALEAALARADAGARVLGSARVLVRDGESMSGGLVRERAYLADYEVNQTGVAPVLNPVVVELLEGTVVEVRAAFFERGGRVALDCRAELSAAAPDVATIRYEPGGDLQQPRLAHLRVGTAVVARFGQTVALAAFEGPVAAAVAARAAPPPAAAAEAPAAGPAAGPVVAVLARLGGAPEPPAPAAAALAAERELRVHAVHAIIHEHRDHAARMPPAADLPAGGAPGGALIFAEEGEPAGLLDASELLERVIALAPEESWDGVRHMADVDVQRGSLVLVHSPDVQIGAAELVERLREQATRGIRYDVLRLRVPSARVPAAFVLDAGARRALLEGATVEARLAVSGLSGQRVLVDAHEERPFLASIERCSGGASGTPPQQVDDPVVRVLRAGSRVALRGSLGADGEVALEVEAALATPPSSVGEGRTTFGAVQLPAGVERLAARHEVVVPAGACAIVAAASAGGETRLLLVEPRPVDRR